MKKGSLAKKVKKWVKIAGSYSGILLLVALLSSAALAESAKTDFRKVSWGATLEEVLKAEGKDPIMRGDELLMFKGTYFGKECAIYYFFEEGKFFGGNYFFIDVAKDFFQELRGLLVKFYGAPKVEVSEQPLSSGSVSSMVVWEKDKVCITLQFSQDILLGQTRMLLDFHPSNWKEVSKNP